MIGNTQPFSRLDQVAKGFYQTAPKSGLFVYLDDDLKYDQPQANISFDRDQAAQLGLTMEDVGGSLATILGGGYVNYFSLSGRSYKVIPQVQQRSRLNVDQLRDYCIRASDGTVVPCLASTWAW